MTKFFFKSAWLVLSLVCIAYTVQDINTEYVKPVVEQVQKIQEISKVANKLKFWE